MAGMRNLLFCDFETRSTVDIAKCGSFKYIADPSFDVLLLAYAWDDEPVKLVDFAQGETWPEDFLQGLRDPDVTCIAHNCAFERAVIGKLLEYTPPEHWFDTMHLTAHCGLPLGLDGACKALGLPEDQAKMKEGKALIRYFCTPPKATKTNGGRPWNLPEHAPEKWDTFRRYCAQDVESMRTIFNLLKRWLPDETERRIWALDAKINEKGMNTDQQFVRYAMEMDSKYKAELTEKAIAVSGIENPNSVQQVKDWLKDQEDIEVPSLNKKEVADVIASLKTDRAKQLMEIRSELSKTSTKKYDAFIRCAGEDDHVRGCFQFFGAHSGRWSGRLVQLQNLKQNHLPDLDDARELVKTGDFECFEMLYPNVTGTLSELIRTSLIAEPGEQFVVSDFSAIEARVSAWFAHEEWVLDVFRNGGDIYCDTASQMFKVPVVKNGENGHLRQKGKVAILACIAEGELVLTDTGLVPIENVTTAMKVWDGENWITHEGLIYKGEREVITYDGLTATPDHLVWVEGEQRPIQLGVAASCGARLVQTGDGRNPIRLGRGYQPGETVEQDLESLLCPDEVRGMRGRSMAEPDEPAARCVEGMPEMLTAEGTTEVVRQETNCRKTEMREPKRRKLRPVRGEGNQIRFSECESCRDVPDRKLWNPRQGTGDGPHRYEWELRPGEYPICNNEGERSEQTMHRSDRMGPAVLALCVHNSDPKAVLRDDEGRDHPGRRDCGVREAKELERDQGKVRVYDLRNAGPNHRFTVSGRLVHNCGYGGGVNALKQFGADKMGMTNEEMAQTVDLWRKANPRICAMWKSLETAMKKCIVHKATTVDKVGGVRFRWEKGIVWMRLPSGREMAYYGAEYEESRFKNGMTLSYLGIDSKKKFTRIETWGGRVFENCWSGGTPVLTNRGWVPIKDVRQNDLLWDGTDWVQHTGVVCRGVKPTILLDGLRVTANHKILTTMGWVNAEACNGLDRARVQLPEGPWEERGEGLPRKGEMDREVHLRKRARYRYPGPPQERKSWETCILRMYAKAIHLREEHQAWHESSSGLRGMALDDTEMHGANTPRLEELRGSWDHCLRKMAAQLRGLLGGHGADVSTRFGAGQGEQRLGIQPRELQMGFESNQLSEQAWRKNCGDRWPESTTERSISADWDQLHHATLQAGLRLSTGTPSGQGGCEESVYDILNAGPRHRYVVLGKTGPIIAHNCVQATARDCLRDTMLRLDADGWDIRGHIHDEVICSEPINGRGVEEMCEVFARPIDWAPGLPLTGAGYTTEYYRKD